MRRLLVLIVPLFLLHACCIKPKDTITPGEMNRLEIAMVRLGKTVESMLWGGVPEDGDLIAMACGRDPALCGAVGDNKLRARVVDGNAVLLLCTPDGKRALVEDIACTSAPDRKAWTENNAACEFTIPDQRVRSACR